MFLKKLAVIVIFFLLSQAAYAATPQVEKAISDLSSPYGSIRQAAVITIGNSGDRSVAPQLLRMLSDIDPDVRTAALWSIGQLKPAGASVAVSSIAYSKLADDRRAAAIALGDLGEYSSGATLTRLLYDSDKSVLKAAINSIAQLKYTPAAARVTALLYDSDPDVRNSAMIAIKALNYNAPSSIVAASMRDTDSRVRGESVTEFAKVAGDSSIPPLVNKLEDPDPTVRKNAALSLGKLKASSAITPLSRHIEDLDPVSKEAAKALGEIGEPAMETLIAALGSASSMQVKENVIEGLAVVGNPAIPTLEAQIETDAAPAAIKALGKISTPEALKVLLGLFNNSKEEIQKAAVEAIGSRGETVFSELKPMAESKKATERRNAAKVFAYIPTEKSIDILIKMLSDKDESVVITASASLGKIGEPAKGKLLEALNSEDDMQRAGAVNSLALMGKNSLPLLLNAFNDKSALVRSGAAMGIGQMNATDSLQDVVNLLGRDQDPSVKKACVWTIEKLGNSSLVDTLFTEKLRAAGKKQFDLVKDIEKAITTLESK